MTSEVRTIDAALALALTQALFDHFGESQVHRAFPVLRNGRVNWRGRPRNAGGAQDARAAHDGRRRCDGTALFFASLACLARTGAL